MKPSNETRLQKLETFHGKQEARLLVIGGSTPAERDANVQRLINSGQATQLDMFICTGVPRYRGNGSTVHDGQD
jgi:hypothetical protein